MYTIISDGVSLAPFQKSDGSWGWYVVEFLMDSREYLNGFEVLVNGVAETEEGLFGEV
jgi:hypothetical protein